MDQKMWRERFVAIESVVCFSVESRSELSTLLKTDWKIGYLHYKTLPWHSSESLDALAHLALKKGRAPFTF